MITDGIQKKTSCTRPRYKMYVSITKISNLFSLNKKQHVSLVLVVTYFLKHYKINSKMQNPQNLFALTLVVKRAQVNHE